MNTKFNSPYYKEVEKGKYIPREQFEIDQIFREFELASARWLESLGFGLIVDYVSFDEKWHKLKSTDKHYDSCTYIGHRNNSCPHRVVFSSFNGGGITETYTIYDYLNERDSGFNPVATTPRQVVTTPRQDEIDHEKWKQAKFEQELAAFYRLPLAEYLTPSKARGGYLLSDTHPYLIKKGISHIVVNQDDVRQGENTGQYKHKRQGKFIVYALKDENDAIKGLQYIYEDGFKQLAIGSKQQGNYQLLNSHYESTGIIYTVEGLATAGAIDLIAKKKGMIVNCVNAGNVRAVIQKLREQYPDHKIIHCADNDWQTSLAGNGNAGIKASMQAVKDIENVKYIVPCFNAIPLTPNEAHKWLVSLDSDLSIGSDWLDLYQLNKKETIEQFNKHSNLEGKSKVIEPENIPSTWGKAVVHLQSVKDIFGLNALRKLADRTALKFVIDEKRKAQLRTLDAVFAQNIEAKDKEVDGRVKTKFDEFLDIGGKEINTRYLSLEDVPLNEGGVFFVQSGLGTGKTQLVEDAKKEWEQENKRSIVVTPRISLARNMSKRLDYANYQDIERKDDPNHLVCVVNSIPTKTKDKHYDFVILDEIEQIISGQICGNTVEDKNGTLEALKNLVQNAKTVVFMDGFLSKNTLDFAQETLGLDKSQFKVIRNTYQSHQGNTHYFYEKQDQLTNDIEHWIKEGENVYVACNTKKEAQKQWLYFREKYPELPILEIDSTNASEEKNQLILENINEQITEFRLVIFSPTVTSGVSIDTPHFTKVCGIFQGLSNIGTPTDCYQQMSRVRNITEWHIFVGGNHKESLPTTKQEIFKGWESVHNYLELLEDSDKPLFTPYAQLYLNTEVLKRKMVSDYRNTFLSLARSDGWKIEVVEPVQIEAIGKIATQYRREWLYQAILNALDRSEKEIEALKDSESTTQSEYFEVVRFNTQAFWGQLLKPEEATAFVEKDHNIPTESGYQTLFNSLPNELNEKILQIDNEGRIRQKLRRLTYPRYDKDEAREIALQSYERHLSKGSEIHADNGLLKHDVYAKVLMTVEIEVDEKGEYFQDNPVTINKSSKEVLDCAHFLLERRDAINEAKLGFRVPAKAALLENPMKTIAEALDALGIKLKKGSRETIGSERVRNYTIELEEIPSLIQFLETEGKNAIKNPSFVLTLANQMPLKEMSTPREKAIEMSVNEVWTNSNEVAIEHNLPSYEDEKNSLIDTLNDLRKNGQKTLNIDWIKHWIFKGIYINQKQFEKALELVNKEIPLRVEGNFISLC